MVNFPGGGISGFIPLFRLRAHFYPSPAQSQATSDSKAETANPNQIWIVRKLFSKLHVQSIATINVTILDHWRWYVFNIALAPFTHSAYYLFLFVGVIVLVLPSDVESFNKFIDRIRPAKHGKIAQEMRPWLIFAIFLRPTFSLNSKDTELFRFISNYLLCSHVLLE